MNKNIAQILNHYESMSNDALLDDMDQITRDIQIIGQAMPDLDENQEYEARNFLSAVLVNVDNMIEHVTGELNTKIENMDKVQKMTEACLAYLQPKQEKQGKDKK